jgi:tetratricopeptide (TPR) repeat protein
MGIRKPYLPHHATALLLLACSCLVQAQETLPNKAAILEQAAQLLTAQQPQEAYQLLQNAENRFGGNADFDLYLGRAALAAGKPAEAVFALERALAVQPNFPQARAELGRAYFYLGENEAAKTELSAIKHDVPPNVQANLQKFLDAIEDRFDSSGKRLEYYVQVGAGNDSNINSAPDLTEIFIPLFAVVSDPLDENSQELDSPYTELEPGIRFSTPLSNNLNFYASADVNLRNAIDASEFSTRAANGVVGLGKLAGSNQYRVALVLQSFAVDGDAYRDQTGISAEWQKTLSANDRISTFFQYADLSYPDFEFRDGDQISAGISWIHGFRSGVFYSSVYLGDEGVDDNGRQFQARDFTGIRFGGQSNWGGNLLFANLNFLNSTYGAEDPLFLDTRNDDYLTLDIGLQIFLASTGRADWRLTPKISVSSNESNIEVFDYDRTVIGITARVDF